MFKFEVHMGDLPRAIATQRGRLVQTVARDAMQDAAEYMVGRLVMNTPSGGTGKARQAIVPTVEFEGMSVVGHIDYAEPASGYIGYPDQGTHHTRMPPYQPIALWVTRVLGTSDPKTIYLVRRAIGRRGLKPQKFVEHTATANGAEASSVFAMGVDRAVKRLGGVTR